MTPRGLPASDTQRTELYLIETFISKPVFAVEREHMVNHSLTGQHLMLDRRQHFRGRVYYGGRVAALRLRASERARKKLQQRVEQLGSEY